MQPTHPSHWSQKGGRCPGRLPAGQVVWEDIGQGGKGGEVGCAPGLALEETERWGTASISSIWCRAEPPWADCSPHPSSATDRIINARWQCPESQPRWSPQEETRPVTQTFGSAPGVQDSYKRQARSREAPRSSPPPDCPCEDEDRWDILGALPDIVSLPAGSFPGEREPPATESGLAAKGGK